MMCQNCNQNEANIKYTQIVNGVKKEMNLCGECAKKLGIDNISFNMHMDFSDFLVDIFDDINQDIIPEMFKKDSLSCGKCGNTYDDFIKSGKFGCDECYNNFNEKIDIILKNIHGANEHIGRNVKRIKDKESNNIEKYISNEKDKNSQENKKERRIKELKLRLKQEIKEERYEDAVKTRDEIKKLEK